MKVRTKLLEKNIPGSQSEKLSKVEITQPGNFNFAKRFIAAPPAEQAHLAVSHSVGGSLTSQSDMVA